MCICTSSALPLKLLPRHLDYTRAHARTHTYTLMMLLMCCCHKGGPPASYMPGNKYVIKPFISSPYRKHVTQLVQLLLRRSQIQIFYVSEVLFAVHTTFRLVLRLSSNRSSKLGSETTEWVRLQWGLNIKFFH